MAECDLLGGSPTRPDDPPCIVEERYVGDCLAYRREECVTYQEIPCEDTVIGRSSPCGLFFPPDPRCTDFTGCGPPDYFCEWEVSVTPGSRWVSVRTITEEINDCSPPCNYTIRDPAASDTPQRDETASRGFKRHNPGCNCCNRVLVWDVGYYDTRLEEGGGAYEQGYTFTDFTLLQEWLENDEELLDSLAHDKIGIDFVTEGAMQGFGFYEGSPNFDSYGQAVDDGFWTGDINDYQLIIWPHPTSDDDLDTDASPCIWCEDGTTFETHAIPTTPPNLPDHPLAGGLPEWWGDVATGKWTGRMLWVTSGNSRGETDAYLGYNQNLFLNTLASTHGMTVDPFALDEHTTEPSPSAGGGLDILSGVSAFPATGTTTKISGGQDLLLASGGQYIRTSPPWCRFVQTGDDLTDGNGDGKPDSGEGEGVYESGFPCAQRSIQVKLQGTGNETAYVDYIIFATDSVVAFDEDVGDNLKKFYLNLVKKPVTNL